MPELIGVGNSPVPRIARQYLFAQGANTGANGTRQIVFVGNATSAGTDPAETWTGVPIASQADVDARAGARSAIRWAYYFATLVDTSATYYFVSVAEGGGAAASTRLFTWATTADVNATLLIYWGGFTKQVTVSAGDTPATQVAAAAAAINADPNWPFSAAQGSGGNTNKLTITAANKGPRGNYVTDRVRFSYSQPIATTITASSSVQGTTADSNANALAAMAKADFYYLVTEATLDPVTPAAITATDGGLGEALAFVAANNLPIPGKDQILIGALDTDDVTGPTNVTLTAAGNVVYGAIVRLYGNDLTPFMNAAILAAVKRSEEVIYPAANLAGYTMNAEIGTTLPILDPFNKANRPAVAEQESDLNQGLTSIAFTDNGAPYIVRQITCYNFIPGTTQKDFRARSGHIPSVIHYTSEEAARRYYARRQPNAAPARPPMQKPLKGFDYPDTLEHLWYGVFDDLAADFPATDGMAILDPGSLAAMKASVSVTWQPGGFFVITEPVPVYHNYFDDTQILQGGDGY